MYSSFSHLDKSGNVSMVDVSDKSPSPIRSASAEAKVLIDNRDTLRQIEQVLQGSTTLKKGDLVSTAHISGIQAAKMTSTLIPLCHQINLSHVSLTFELIKAAEPAHILVQSHCKTKDAQTGVEMEALVAASIASLTIYDMCKAIDKSLVITDVRLTCKSGGKSGDYNRQSSCSDQQETNPQ
ncbi:hypothetical protein MIR68_006208 [Amoeboaphelidium protococcarum]|nr:hypothetical protein MIR68_006208 [Amoeboaphelidium protococcarum]